MNLDTRTTEAFRAVNRELKSRGRRYTMMFPVHDQCHDSYWLMVTGPDRKYTAGRYRTQDELRAGVETVAEVLDEVV